MNEPKFYQREAIEHLQHWLDALQSKSKEMPDWNEVPLLVWEKLRKDLFVTDQHESRQNKAGKEIAHTCLKMPTGSGKTYVAAQALNTIMHTWEKKKTGLVIWFVPLEKIYEQTRKAFRQDSWIYEYLTEQCGLPIQLVTKEDALRGRLNERMLENNLCILVLSQQSLVARGNQSGAKTLRRIKRDSSIEAEIFPESNNRVACERFHQAHPEIEYKEGKNGVPIPKRSVVNFIRLNRPVVIIDESHKTQSKQATKEISELNPSIILEISATPSHKSNVLYKATGRKVWEEDMIKLPIQTSTEATWKKTLQAAKEKLRELDKLAKREHAQGGRYIRPIMVVRTEYTGKDQSSHALHVENVRRVMETELDIHPNKIAIQSAEKKSELRGVDLLSKTCEIRYILTKSALTEGWDCPFAYVLAILDNFTSPDSVTQLMGRVMRQPYARKSEAADLNKAYVFCTNQKTEEVAQIIAKSLDILDYKDAHDLAEMAGGAIIRDEGARGAKAQRRLQFREWEIYFPNIKFQSNGKLRKFNYDTDLIPRIDFSKLKYRNWRPIAESSPHTEISEIGFGAPKFYEKEILTMPSEFDYRFLTNELLEFIPNIFIAGRLVRETLESYVKKHGHKKVYPYAPSIIQDLKKDLLDQYKRLAKSEFKKMLNENLLVTRLEKQLDWQMPDENFYDPDNLFGQQYNLFEHVSEETLDNESEKKVARKLEGSARKKLIDWWFKSTTHKLPEQQEAYYLQGWLRKKFYPDFLIAHAPEEKSEKNYFVIDTKGGHLIGNEDTNYKRDLMKEMEDRMSQNSKDEDSYRFRIIDHGDWERDFPELLRS